MVLAGFVFGQERQRLWCQNVDVVYVEHVQNEDQPSFHSFTIKLFDLGLLFFRVQSTNLFEAVSAFIGVEKQSSGKLAFYSIDLLIGKDSDGYWRLENVVARVYIGGVFDIDKSVVIAAVSQIAGALEVDILKNAGEQPNDISSVSLVIVDDVVGFLDNFEKVGHLGHNMLVEWLLYLIQVILLSHQNAHRVYILLSLVDLLIILVLAQQRLHYQKVVVLELDGQNAVAEFLPRQNEIRVKRELLFGEHSIGGYAFDKLKPSLVVKLADTYPHNLHL